MAGFALWYPKQAFPLNWEKLPDGRKKFKYLCVAFSLISTFLGFLQPVVNAFILLTLGVPTMCLLLLELKVENDLRVISLGRRSITLWVLAVICWVNDRIFCSWWASVGFPYLHGAWHILIFLASYTAVVLFAYFEVKNNMDSETPILRYYPSDDFQLGVPYVALARDVNGNKEGNMLVEKKVHLI